MVSIKSKERLLSFDVLLIGSFYSLLVAQLAPPMSNHKNKQLREKS